jgi:hypothetical protein
MSIDIQPDEIEPHFVQLKDEAQRAFDGLFNEDKASIDAAVEQLRNADDAGDDIPVDGSQIKGATMVRPVNDHLRLLYRERPTPQQHDRRWFDITAIVGAREGTLWRMTQSLLDARRSPS